jgi:prefoldin subunit 5
MSCLGRFVLICGLLLVGTPLSAQVVVQGGAGGAGGGWSYANPMGQSLQYLLYPQVQSELDLLPDQKAALDKIRNEMTAKLQDAYKELKDVPPADRQAKYLEVYSRVGADTDKRVAEVLLPHQTKRIRQIALQMRLANSGYGSAAAFNTDDVAKELGVTPEQIEELKKREAELRQEIQDKTREFYKKLNEETREKLLGVLTAAQREKLRELQGEKFELNPYAFPGAGNPKGDEKKK